MGTLMALFGGLLIFIRRCGLDSQRAASMLLLFDKKGS